MDVLENLQHYQRHATGDTAVPELDAADLRPKDYQAYRIDPQVRPSNALIDFWLAGGNQRAISYAHLYDIEYNPSQGMQLTFSEHRVTISGYRLHELYRGLKRQRIVFVWEASRQDARLAADDQAVVTGITIEPRQNPFPQ